MASFRLVLQLLFFTIWNTEGLWYSLYGLRRTRRASVFVMSELTNSELVSTTQKAIEFHKNGNIEDAIVHYEKVLPQLGGKTKASLSGNVGSLYMSQGNYERAAVHFTAAVDADGSNPSAHFNLAVLLTTKLGQHGKAIKHCGKAINLDPENFKAHHLMGNIMQSIGRPEEADRYFVAAENLALQAKEASTVPTSESDSSHGSVLDKLRLFSAKAGDSFGVTHEGVQYTVECVSEAPRIFIVEDLITAEECAHIKTRASGLLEKSYVMGGGSGGYEEVQDAAQASSSREVAESLQSETDEAVDPALYRSSYNAWLSQDAVLNALLQRLVGILGIPAPYLQQKSEQLQVVRYRPGGQFKAHQDSSAFNSRLVTALLYLNTPEDAAGRALRGGETWFPFASGEHGDAEVLPSMETVEDCVREALRMHTSHLASALPGIKVAPKQGKAVIFLNHLRSGAIDPLAVHAGLPLTALGHEPTTSDDSARGLEAEKWVANYWIEFDPVALSEYLQ